jgi:hypothetical protein
LYCGTCTTVDFFYVMGNASLSFYFAWLVWCCFTCSFSWQSLSNVGCQNNYLKFLGSFFMPSNWVTIPISGIKYCVTVVIIKLHFEKKKYNSNCGTPASDLWGLHLCCCTWDESNLLD